MDHDEYRVINDQIMTWPPKFRLTATHFTVASNSSKSKSKSKPNWIPYLLSFILIFIS